MFCYWFYKLLSCCILFIRGIIFLIQLLWFQWIKNSHWSFQFCIFPSLIGNIIKKFKQNLVWSDPQTIFLKKGLEKFTNIGAKRFYFLSFRLNFIFHLELCVQREITLLEGIKNLLPVITFYNTIWVS